MAFAEVLGNVSILSIVLFVVGIGLIVVELFEPGFGFFGALGIISLIVCIFVTAQTVMEGIILTGIFFVIVLILLAIFLIFVSKGRLPRKLILHDAETLEQGFSGTEDLNYLLGKVGEVVTICRPVGNVDFDGKKLDVISRGEYINKGTIVEVIEIEGNRIVVKAKTEEEE